MLHVDQTLTTILSEENINVALEFSKQKNLIKPKLSSSLSHLKSVGQMRDYL